MEIKKRHVFLWVFALFLVFLASQVSSLTYINSCGAPLTTAGETYVLTQDVTADGGCFIISADNIVLNLNGKTITWGLNPPWVDNCATYYVYASGYVCSFGIRINGDNFKILNGTLIQGGNLLRYSEPIRVGGNNGEIAYMNIYYYSNDTSGIRGTGLNHGLVIHHNLVNSTASFVIYRAGGVANIDFTGTTGNMTIYNNTIMGGPQWGIRATGVDPGAGETFWDVQPYGGIFIYDNYIRHNGVMANSYGIGLHNVDSIIRNNVINPISGAGIHLTRPNVTIENNYINVTARVPISEALPSTGIKMENQYSQSVIRNNTVNVYADAVDQHGSVLDVSLWDGSDINVTNNTFYAFFPNRPDGIDDLSAVVYGYGEETGINMVFTNNIMMSNHMFVTARHSGGYTFINNRFILVPPIYNTPYFFYYWNGPSHNYLFLNNTFEGGIDSRDSYIRQTDTMNYSVGWYLTTRVRNTGGSPLSGANLVFRDNLGSSFSRVTDLSGFVIEPLLEFDRAYFGSVVDTQFSPYNVSASYGGELQWQLVTLDQSKEIIFTFAGGNSPDVNSDGNINILDLALEVFWQGRNSGQAGWTNYDHLDLNEDSYINFDDVRIIINNM